MKQETLEDVIYQNIGLAANKQGIINQALATSNIMKKLEERTYNEEEVIDIFFLGRESLNKSLITKEEALEVIKQFKKK